MTSPYLDTSPYPDMSPYPPRQHATSRQGEESTRRDDKDVPLRQRQRVQEQSVQGILKQLWHQETVFMSTNSAAKWVAERANRTIMEAARSMLHTHNVGREYWAEAVCTVVYVRNSSPSKVLSVTPMEM